MILRAVAIYATEIRPQNRYFVRSWPSPASRADPHRLAYRKRRENGKTSRLYDYRKTLND